MPSNDKRASSEAAWALLTQGVTSARLELHRLRHLVNRSLRLVEDSPQKEHLYQVAGDIIQAMPKRVDRMTVILDRTSLALSRMGGDYLSARLPLEDKQLVEEAVAPAGGFRKSRLSRLAGRWLRKQAAKADASVGDYHAFLDYSGPAYRIWNVYRDTDEGGAEGLVGAILFDRASDKYEAKAGDMDHHSVAELRLVGVARNLKQALAILMKARI